MNRKIIKKLFVKEDVILGIGCEADLNNPHYIRSFSLGIKPFKKWAKSSGFI